MKLIDRIILSNFLQRKKPGNRNRAAFMCLRDLGFSLPAVRAMLIKGNNIKVSELARGTPVTAPTIYSAAYGRRANIVGRKILAVELGMDVKELFPPDDVPGEMTHGH